MKKRIMMSHLSLAQNPTLFVINISSTKYNLVLIPLKNPDLHFRRKQCIMNQNKDDYSFWSKYKQFASNEILLYVIMVVGILLGILIFS
ncbi:hypothetical protein A5893_07395 [Pedobacter psychrophilus]|uniref:Uncharacterized protein n=1 Tax=Pedobacter psychrophilus TaxID=1826909 RepID=A0A179DIP6_9SPHI|nr:hypothetical protein A5893_07395 [Pedobacter psychrophilus]